MQGKNGLIVGLIVIVLIAGLAFFLLRQSSPAPAVPRGRAAPDVVTKTLDGRTWRLSDQRGKVVLLDFWATWCVPCVVSMPHLKEIYERFKSDPDFLMVGVSLDDGPDEVRQFVQQNEIPWLQLFDPAQPLAREFGITGIPSVWVIGREGQIVSGYIAPQDIERTVAAELARK